MKVVKQVLQLEKLIMKHLFYLLLTLFSSYHSLAMDVYISSNTKQRATEIEFSSKPEKTVSNWLENLGFKYLADNKKWSAKNSKNVSYNKIIKGFKNKTWNDKKPTVSNQNTMGCIACGGCSVGSLGCNSSCDNSLSGTDDKIDVLITDNPKQNGVEVKLVGKQTDKRVFEMLKVRGYMFHKTAKIWIKSKCSDKEYDIISKAFKDKEWEFYGYCKKEKNPFMKVSHKKKQEQEVKPVEPVREELEEEEYDSYPNEVKAIVDSYDYEADRYKEAARIEKKLKAIGWSCEWGLDGEIYNVKKDEAPKPVKETKKNTFDLILNAQNDNIDINVSFKEWHSIKTDNDLKKWSEKWGKKRYGTYQTETLLQKLYTQLSDGDIDFKRKDLLPLSDQFPKAIQKAIQKEEIKLEDEIYRKKQEAKRKAEEPKEEINQYKSKISLRDSGDINMSITSVNGEVTEVRYQAKDTDPLSLTRNDLDSIISQVGNNDFTFYTNAGVDLHSSEKGIFKGVLVKLIPYNHEEPKVKAVQEIPKEKPKAEKVEIEIEYEIIETQHTKTGKDIWIAKFTKRHDKVTFAKVHERVKSFKGRYSGYTKNGAIAGFHFKTKADLENFLDAKATPTKVEVESEPVSRLPLYQHIAAYLSLQDAKKPTTQWNTTKKGTKVYINNDGLVIIATELTDTTIEKSPHHHTRYISISKLGKVEGYYPKEEKAKTLYKFDNIKEPVMLHSDNWYYRVDTKYNYAINQQTLKQRTNFIAKMKGLGFETKQANYKILISNGTTPQEIKNANDPKHWEEIEISARVNVPKDKRQPFYDLAKNPKINKGNLIREVLLGKMEVAQIKGFDGMQDMTYYIENPVWKHTTEFPDIAHYDTSARIDGNQINYDWYALRYKGKGISKAVIHLDQPIDSKITHVSKESDYKALAVKFEKTADRLDKSYNNIKEKLKGYNRNTPKRNLQYNHKRIDGEIIYESSTYYRALAKAYSEGNVPKSLLNISPVLADNHVYLFIKGTDTSGGYYSAVREQEPQFRKKDKYSLERAKEIGLNSHEEIEQAYKDLESLVSQESKGDLTEKAKKDKISRLVDEWRFTKQAGFFPTPKPLVNQMIKAAEILKGNTVLEPSAGLGHIAEVIREQYPNNKLDVVEYWSSLREILDLKGFNVVGENFLEYGGYGSNIEYDRIIMNPPFEKYQDIDHVRNAFMMLADGGRLVAIVGSGAMNNSQKKAKEFQEFVNENGYAVENPANSFKSAFKSTGVNTYMVVLDKDEQTEPTKPKKKVESVKETKEAPIPTYYNSQVWKEINNNSDEIQLNNLYQAVKGALATHRKEKSKNVAFWEEAYNEISTKLAKIEKSKIRKLAKSTKKAKNQQEVNSISIKDIHTNKAIFQNRENDFSSESRDRIIAAVIDGTFNWALLDPIILWEQPKTKKLFVLSGHSRFAAFQYLGKEGFTVDKKKFTSIPAKIVTVTEKEAVKIALESNTLSTKETKIERANYYRSLRTKGSTKKEIELSAKKNEGKNAKAIINLSHLKKNGLVLDSVNSLSDSDTSNKAAIEVIAEWIGEARASYQDLTDQHETELYKWLTNDAYGTKAGQFTNKKAFLERLHVAIQKNTQFGVFEQNEPLNIKKSVFKNSIEQDFDKKADELKKNVTELDKILKSTTERAYASLEAKKTTQNIVDDVISKAAAQYSSAKSKLNLHLGNRNNVLTTSKAQTSLFGIAKSKKRANKNTMSVKDQMSKEYKYIGLNQHWQGVIGNACHPTSIGIYGEGGTGKSHSTFKLIEHLTEEDNKVLYVSYEQFNTPTMSNLLRNTGIDPDNDHLVIANRTDENVPELNPINYDFVVYDSKDSVNMTVGEWRKIKKSYPNTSFIVLFQSNKDGSYAGEGKWRNEIDTWLFTPERGTISTGFKNRWDIFGSIEV